MPVIQLNRGSSQSIVLELGSPSEFQVYLLVELSMLNLKISLLVERAFVFELPSQRRLTRKYSN